MPHKVSKFFCSLLTCALCFTCVMATAESSDAPSSGIDWRSPDIARISKSDSKPWKFAVQIAGDLGSPFKDKRYTDVIGGLGYEANILAAITNRFALRLTFGRSGLHEADLFRYQTNAGETAPLPPYIYVLTDRTELSITRYFLSGQFNAPPLDLYVTDAFFYLYAGLGAVNHNTTLVVETYNDSTGAGYTSVDQASITRFANTFGGGMLFMLTRDIGLDFSLGCDLVYAGEQPVYAAQDLYSHRRAYNYDGTFNVKLGLMALL